MRPLPIAPIPDAPPFVAGTSVIRGEPIPVLNLAILLNSAPDKRQNLYSSLNARFVTMRLPQRCIVLQVDSVEGIEEIQSEPLRQALPLLANVDAQYLTAIGTRDASLLLTLDASRIIPETMWKSLLSTQVTS